MNVIGVLGPGNAVASVNPEFVRQESRSLSFNASEITLTKAIEVGVFCLERGRTAQDTDFVKRKITELLAEVEEGVRVIPTKAEEALLKRIGTAMPLETRTRGPQSPRLRARPAARATARVATCVSPLTPQSVTLRWMDVTRFVASVASSRPAFPMHAGNAVPGGLLEPMAVEFLGQNCDAGANYIESATG